MPSDGRGKKKKNDGTQKNPLNKDSNGCGELRHGVVQKKIKQ